MFLDDDVVLPPDWASDLQFDLGQAPARIAGIQGTIEVPLPLHRNRPMGRGTSPGSSAQWATADMAYRRSVLELVGGFDESVSPGRTERTPISPFAPWTRVSVSAEVREPCCTLLARNASSAPSAANGATRTTPT